MQEYSENPEASAWVMAHAGSGKTYALVRRVIALLLAGADPRSIWCVTYTNIAAAEMLTRTTEMLEALNQMDDATMKAELLKYLGMTAGDGDVARIRALHQRMRQPAERVMCTTVHGLCQYILRIFALELGISPNFSALEAEAQRQLMQRACEQVLSRAVDPSHPLAGALDYMAQRMGSYGTMLEYVRTMLERRDVMFEALRHYHDYDGVAQALFATCNVQPDWHADALIQAAFDATPPQMREVMHALEGGAVTDIKTKDAIAHWLEKGPRAWHAYLAGFIKKDGLPLAKICTKYLPEGSPLHGTLYREQARIIAVRDQLANLACAHNSAHLAHVFFAVAEAYRELKAEAEALDFDDMIGFVQRLLSDPQSLGYVMSKLDYRVEHILLDEAQDTSPVQWQILSTLVEDLCAAAEGSKGPPRSVFVVGDAKQSIYSFQGAAPWMMQAQRDRFASWFTGNGKPFTIGALTQARRSVPKVLEFVDAVGSHADVRRGWMEAPSPHIPTRSGAGHIALWPLVTHDEKTERAPYEIPTHYSLGTRAPRKLAEQIAARIHGWISDKRPLSSTGEPVQAGDIMIIVRRRGQLVPALIRALEMHGVPVAGIDRVKLSEHVFVRDVLALIRWSFQHDDDVSLAELLRSPIGGLSEDALFALAHGRVGSLWQALCAQPHYAPLAAQLQALAALRHQPVYQLLAQLLYGQDALTRYRARLGDEVQEIIDEVLHYAAALEGEVDALPMHFLMRMATSQAEVKRESAPGNHVRILTVHGAKGLEAPIVILADMADAEGTQKERVFTLAHDDGPPLCLAAYSDDAKLAPIWAQAKQEKAIALDDEYYRQLYVALTRARDELYLCTAQGKSAPSALSWYHICAQVLAAMPGAVTDDDGIITWADAVTAKPCAAAAGGTTPPLPSWFNTTPAMRVAPRVLTPSSVSSDDHDDHAWIMPTESTEADARDYGTALHGLFEWAGAHTAAEQIEAALALSGLPPADTARIMQSWQTLWQQHEIAALLNAPSLREQAISAQLTLGDATYPVYGIIDRLMVDDTHVTVLDYKTALNPPPADALPAHYVAQLALYRAVLARIYPQKTVRCALLWTHTARLDWLSEAAMDAALTLLTNNLSEQSRAFLDAAQDAA